MKFLSAWWGKAETDEKIIQLLVILLVVSVSLDRTVLVSVSAAAVCLFMIYDCMKQKSLRGFYSPRRNWLGIAVFLVSVLAASVLLGDMASIHIALKYIYWAMPFLMMVYFENRTNTKYAVVAGVLLSLAVSFASVVYLSLHGQGTAAGRIGAFSLNPNYYSGLLISILPVLFCALFDTKLKGSRLYLVLNTAVIIIGLFALWKTGSRGAMGGLFTGALVALFFFCHFHENGKLFLKGFLLCAAVISLFLLAGIPGGTERLGDRVRLRQVQSCYAMWKDHMALGVGLNNWEQQYRTVYVQAEVIKQEAARRYEVLKAARQRTAKKKAAAQKAVKQQAAGSVATQKPAVKGNTAKKAAVQKPKAKLTAKQKAAAKRKAVARKKADRKEAARKAAFQNRILKHEAELPIPHNVVAWFFSTTGITGGAGYLFFVFYYLWRLYRKIHEEPENWVAFAGFWVFIAVTFHGLFDAGITNKAFARILYLMLGLALSYSCCQKQEKLTDNQNG
jgi:hypothetical protein